MSQTQRPHTLVSGTVPLGSDSPTCPTYPKYLSRDARKTGFLTRSDIKQSVQPLKQARSLKFRI